MPVWHSRAMSIVAARRYSGGKVIQEHLPVDGTPRDALPPHSFDWVGLAEPGAEEMELVRSQFGLHPLAVEDALNPTQMPKVEVYGAQLFIVARTAAMTNGENIEYGQTALFLGRDFIVTVRFGSSRAHSELRTRLESDDQHLAEGPDYVTHAILDFVVDGFQFSVDVGRKRLFLVELCLVGKFFASDPRIVNACHCRQDGEIDVGFSLFLRQVDIFRRRVGVEQGLIAPAQFTVRVLQLLLPAVLNRLLGLLFGRQRWADFPDDVAATVEYPIGSAPTLLRQSITADTTAATGVMATVELAGRL